MKRALLAICGVLLSMPAFAGGHFAPHSFGAFQGAPERSRTILNDGITPPASHAIIGRGSDGITPPAFFRIGRPSDGITPPASFRVGRPSDGVTPPAFYRVGDGITPPASYRTGVSDGITPPAGHTVGTDTDLGPLVRPAWQD